MREIEFRAWDDNNGEMIQNVPVMNGCAMVWRIAPPDSPVVTVDGKDGKTNFYCDWDFLKEVPYLKVMQYTGLKDIKGTKIFEGDLLHCLDPVSFSPKRVDFSDGSFVIDLGESWEQVISQSWIVNCEFVVIGNIHQNPELLEQAK